MRLQSRSTLRKESPLTASGEDLRSHWYALIPTKPFWIARQRHRVLCLVSDCALCCAAWEQWCRENAFARWPQPAGAAPEAGR